MVEKDMMPIKVVDDEGFLNNIEPGYHIASGAKKGQNENKDKLKVKLLSSDNVVTMTDCWTALATEGYITVTCHYIGWHLKPAVLSYSRPYQSDKQQRHLLNKMDEI